MGKCGENSANAFLFSKRGGLSVVGLSTALSLVPRPSLNLGLALATPSLPLFPLSLSSFAHVFS